MASFDIKEFKNLLPPAGRLLGLDLGSKTIGLAMSDERRQIASPLETITRGKFSKDAEALKKLIEKHQICALVIGYPLNMDGSEGPRCQSTRQFIRNLQSPLPLLFWDERMSSMAVNRMMTDEADLSRQRRGELVDKLAASYILQGVLEYLR